CSLTAGTDKAALVCLMKVNAKGQIKSWHFTRALVRCAVNLAYEQAQAAIDGNADEHTAPYLKGLWNLWGGWGALKAARDYREPLDLDLPEKRVILDRSEERRVGKEWRSRWGRGSERRTGRKSSRDERAGGK